MEVMVDAVLECEQVVDHLGCAADVVVEPSLDYVEVFGEVDGRGSECRRIESGFVEAHGVGSARA